jgi:drug/metabolite transporter (DMT)-like permease
MVHWQPRQILVLALMTLVWGCNWPLMKWGIADYPALMFRVLSICIGLPVLGVVLWRWRIPFRVARAEWGELLHLSIPNMFLWYGLMMLALPNLNSGRAAILGYTMPIFSAVFGYVWFGAAMGGRAWLGVAAAALGALLLVWHEITALSGHPGSALMLLVAASAWAYGTQRMRRTTMQAHTLTIAFWMTAMTGVVLTLLSWLLEGFAWHPVTRPAMVAIVYNGLGVFAFAQVAWLVMARNLPPLASTLSVMMIPVLGVLVGALALGEVLHWQDLVAVSLIVAAIASVLWPTHTAPKPPAADPHVEA